MVDLVVSSLCVFPLLYWSAWAALSWDAQTADLVDRGLGRGCRERDQCCPAPVSSGHALTLIQRGKPCWQDNCSSSSHFAFTPTHPTQPLVFWSLQ